MFLKMYHKVNGWMLFLMWLFSVGILTVTLYLFTIPLDYLERKIYE